METWLILTITTCLAFLFKAIISSTKPKSKLPPGPRHIPIISSLKWFVLLSSKEFDFTLPTLFSKFGPIVTLPLGSRRLILVSSHALAHKALVQKGSVLVDRPEPLPTAHTMTSFKDTIFSSSYGPFWRSLRRNLTSQMLAPSRIKDYSQAWKWVLGILTSRLSSSASTNENSVVKLADHFRFAIFCLLALMCFGDKLEESKIKKIETLQKQVELAFTSSQILNICPWLTRTFLRKRWDELSELSKKQKDLFEPLIRRCKGTEGKSVISYVHTLMSLEIEDENEGKRRKLSDDEIVSACSEFFTGGTDSTSTTLEWIMANLVKYPKIQAKLYDEIKAVVGEEAKGVGQDDVARMPYLKAIVYEGLRRHPPAHTLFPHLVTGEVELGGYVVPKGALVNCAVAEMGRDPNVWKDPMGFKPERFLESDMREWDITGAREIKMMPFGAGRRICPGMGLALLLLQYFVANLVWEFEWEVAKGHEVDLSEEKEFLIVMKHPLHARISPRLPH